MTQKTKSKGGIEILSVEEDGVAVTDFFEKPQGNAMKHSTIFRTKEEADK